MFNPLELVSPDKLEEARLLAKKVTTILAENDPSIGVLLLVTEGLFAASMQTATSEKVMEKMRIKIALLIAEALSLASEEEAPKPEIPPS